MTVGKPFGNMENVMYINGESIKNVDSFKYLGIVIDTKLNFHEHIRNVNTNISSKVGVFFSRQLTIQAKLTIYKTIIKPNVEYYSTVLYLCSNHYINKLQDQQNNVIRCILKRQLDTRIYDMLQELKWNRQNRH